MSFLRPIKRALYFPAAGYFAFFARIYLRRWKPFIITVTGSSGKTTLLHLFEAQLGAQAVYSHNANSAFGIPFNILGLERDTFHSYEWFLFFVLAPFKAWRPIRSERIYVSEADAERPGEAPLLASVLLPDILVWLSLEEAHGTNYRGDFETVKRAMASEFGALLASTKGVAVINSDNSFITEQVSRTRTTAKITRISQKDISSFSIQLPGVQIAATSGSFSVPALIPPSAALSVLAVVLVLKQSGHPIDSHFSKFHLPPGRSSVFKGKHNTTLIDSSYNATFDGMRSMLELFAQYPASGPKWLVLGDMVEQGASEQFEHETLARMIQGVRPNRIVLVGPRLKKYTYPLLASAFGENIVSYLMPGEALAYLENELNGGEVVLFKGARFLEGVVEKLLDNPSDASRLCRREMFWVRRRKQWGI